MDSLVLVAARAGNQLLTSFINNCMHCHTGTGAYGSSTKHKDIGILSSLLVAAVAGVGNQLLTMPAGVVTTRMQVSEFIIVQGPLVNCPRTFGVGNQLLTVPAGVVTTQMQVSWLIVQGPLVNCPRTLVTMQKQARGQIAVFYVLRLEFAYVPAGVVMRFLIYACGCDTCSLCPRTRVCTCASGYLKTCGPGGFGTLHLIHFPA